MNVNDVSSDLIPTPTPDHDRLALIFERQKQLMEKYHPIEEANGFRVISPPLSLHDRFSQARIKDFAWRITEEIGEATAALVDHPDDPTHFYEELADAFHFLIELYISIGWDDRYIKWPSPENTTRRDCRFMDIFEQLDDTSEIEKIIGTSGKIEDIRRHAYNCIEQITRTMNCLKQKPWKQTHIMTDTARFEKYLLEAFFDFLSLCSIGGLGGDELFRIYYRKSEVNRFRQRSNY